MGEISEALRRAKAAREQPGANDSIEADVHAAFDDDWREGAREDLGQEPGSWLFSANVEPRESEIAPAARRVVLSQNKGGRWRSRAVLADQRGPIAESCRQLAVRMRAELERRSARSVALVSPLRGDGKSTLACNLALALASLSRGRSVAIVELDLRAPSLATTLRTGEHLGVETFLEGKQSLSEIRVSVEKPALDLYLAGQDHSAAHEYLVRPQMARLVRELERRYEVVVFDTPPVLLVPDAALILRHVAAYAAVAKAGSTRVRALRSMLEVLPAEKLIGGILNQSPSPTHTSHYRYDQPESGPAGGR